MSYLLCVLLSADFIGDFEKNVEAQILRRIEVLPAGQSDPMLMKMLRFASGRRPWLAWNIENFNQLNSPEIRFQSWTDDAGQMHSCDNLAISMRKLLDLEEITQPRYQFSGPHGRCVPSPSPRYQG